MTAHRTCRPDEAGDNFLTDGFFTIGHSTRQIKEFASLLESSSVRTVADVRTVPRSRTNPQYNRDSLPHALAEFAIGYEHIAALGGLRGKSTDVCEDLNAFWQNRSFHNYADYAMGSEYRDGLQSLRALRRPCAIMCAETLWWRCHRRIVADYLIALGEPVFHILGPGQVQRAQMAGSAIVGPDSTLVYPAT